MRIFALQGWNGERLTLNGEREKINDERLTMNDEWGE